MLKKIYTYLRKITFAPFVISDYIRFKNKRKSNRFSLSFSNLYPQIKDRTITTHFDRHYIYHTGWAARIIKKIQPTTHIDISSSLYFTSIASAFIPIQFYDYRPPELILDNVDVHHADLTNLHFKSDSISSLSCMHTIEHIGLGRYGDPIDPDGDIKAAHELSRVLAPEGSFIFVVPVGRKSIIEFNAHRIYSYKDAIELFPDLELQEFSLIPEHTKDGALLRNANPELLENEHYACGCFWFKKPSQ